MTAATLRGELIKAATTRTLLGYGLTGVAFVLVQVLIITQTSEELDTLSDKQDVIAGAPVILLLLGLVGAAGEYRHRTAAPAALVADCDRGRLLVARAGAYALTGLAVAAAMSALSLALGLPLLTGEPGPALGGGDVAAVVGPSLLAAALSAIIGVAVGALLRNQVAGVIGVLLVSFMINPLLGSIHDGLGELTPFGAGATLAYALPGELLSKAGAALVLLAWTVPLLAAAVIAERRRDLG